MLSSVYCLQLGINYSINRVKDSRRKINKKYINKKKEQEWSYKYIFLWPRVEKPF